MKKKLLALLLCIMMAVCVLPVGASAAETGNVTITKTDIHADTVFNTNGYGSLQISDFNEYNTTSPKYEDGTPGAALVDRTGKFVFPYKYTRNRYYYSDGIVSLTGSCIYIRNRLWEYSPGAYEDYDYIDRYDQVGFWKLDGSAAFPGKFFGSTAMLDGYAFVSELETNANGEELWDHCICRMIDKDGKTAFSYRAEISDSGWWDNADVIELSEYADWFQEGLLRCWSDTDFVYYKDTTGKTVLRLSADKYINASLFSEGYAWVEAPESYLIGYIDKSGKEIIPCMYTFGGSFNDGLAFVAKGDKYGYINAKNEVVIPFEYDGAYGAGGGLATVAKDGKYGLVDYNNNVIVPFVYDDISSYEGGVAYAIRDGILYIITGFNADEQLHGDIDGDGKISNSDLIMVARYVVDLFNPTQQESLAKYGDMNGDGQVTNTDIITIARIIVGLE